MRIALYARVSTSDQNCAIQLTALRDYVAARGWQTAGEYVDQGASGKNTARPQFQRLLADARQRRMDCIAVWKIDRFSRSVLDLATTVQELDSLGVRFTAITQGIDTDAQNPMARFMLQIMGAFAEMERAIIRERVQAGVDRARREGKRLGRPRTVVDALRVRELRGQGKSWEQVAAATGATVGTVRRVAARGVV